MRFDEHMVVARTPRLTLRDLRLWVREGWVRPAQGPSGPVFDELDLARLRLICDLRKDMALPFDVVPTVLALIDQLHRTRHDLRCLAEAVDEQPESVRQAVLASFRRRTGRAG